MLQCLRIKHLVTGTKVHGYHKIPFILCLFRIFQESVDWFFRTHLDQIWSHLEKLYELRPFLLRLSKAMMPFSRTSRVCSKLICKMFIIKAHLYRAKVKAKVKIFFGVCFVLYSLIFLTVLGSILLSLPLLLCVNWPLYQLYFSNSEIQIDPSFNYLTSESLFNNVLSSTEI